jgi:hypothetical protein
MDYHADYFNFSTRMYVLNACERCATSEATSSERMVSDITRRMTTGPITKTSFMANSSEIGNR